MNEILNPFKKKKKISMDLDEKVLEVIDSLAYLTKTNRTVIIEAVLTNGLFSYINFLEKTWKGYLNDKEKSKIKNDIQKLLKDLEEIKQKNVWLSSEYYLNYLSSKKDIDDKTRKNLLDTLKNMGLIPEN